MVAQVLKVKNPGPRKTLWRTAGLKFLNHLGYLGPPLVGLTLFDPEVDDATKTAIASAMQDNGDVDASPPTITKLCAKVLKLNLEDFATPNSRHLFQKLGVEPSFLSKPPSEWAGEESFDKLSRLINNLRSTNDTAERAVKLATDFNNKLTKDPVQRQGLLVTVANDRKSVQQD